MNRRSLLAAIGLAPFAAVPAIAEPAMDERWRAWLIALGNYLQVTNLRIGEKEARVIGGIPIVKLPTIQGQSLDDAAYFLRISLELMENEIAWLLDAANCNDENGMRTVAWSNEERAAAMRELVKEYRTERAKKLRRVA